MAEWYPKELPASQRLARYAEHFQLVEVNSTFYRLPEPKSTKSWCDQTPTVLFRCKAAQTPVRHSTKPELLPVDLRSKVAVPTGKVELTEQAEAIVVRRFLQGVAPLRDCGKLWKTLFQLSPGFSPRHNRLTELDHLLQCLEGFKVAIELRNRGWAAEDKLKATKQFFSKRKITFVMVDAPVDPHFTILPNIDLVTNHELAYLRAHGRNREGLHPATYGGRPV